MIDLAANSIIDRLIAFRQKNTLTQQQVASAIGISVTEVSRWERKIHKPNRIAIRAIETFMRKGA